MAAPALVALALTSEAVASKTDYGSTQGMIEFFEYALESLHEDIGRYPTSAEGLSLLAESPSPRGGWNGPYIRRVAPPDAWGRPFVYRHPARYGPGPFDLYSTGLDGRDDHGGGDDITGWSPVPCEYVRRDPAWAARNRWRLGIMAGLGLCAAGFVRWSGAAHAARRRLAAALALPALAALGLAGLVAWSVSPAIGAVAAVLVSGTLLLPLAGLVRPRIVNRSLVRAYLGLVVVGPPLLLAVLSVRAWARGC